MSLPEEVQKAVAAAELLALQHQEAARQLDEYYLEGVRKSNHANPERTKAAGWENVPLKVKDEFYSTRASVERGNARAATLTSAANTAFLEREAAYANLWTPKETDGS